MRTDCLPSRIARRSGRICSAPPTMGQARFFWQWFPGHTSADQETYIRRAGHKIGGELLACAEISKDGSQDTCHVCGLWWILVAVGLSGALVKRKRFRFSHRTDNRLQVAMR